MRILWGLTLLVAPSRVLHGLDTPAPRGVRRVARLLGARHLGQAAAVTLFPQPAVRRWSRRVDEAHGLSMAVLAVASSRYRRAALFSCAVAAAFSQAPAEADQS
ncbi:MAG TPA: hypothetical protein VG405_03670 [Solirubrobacteraceae bacterium]|nr:hypothetical protein [Solirubrobacteraceae bacterium]